LSHMTLLVLLTALLWSFKFNLFKNEDVALLLVGLYCNKFPLQMAVGVCRGGPTPGAPLARKENPPST
jgi:hypothetical protein